MSDINKQADLPQTPHAIYLKDYQAPAYWVDQVEMEFVLAAETTQVTTVLHIQRNDAVANAKTPLVLNGDQLSLVSLALDGQPLASTAYQVDAESLTIPNVPAKFILQTVVEIHPAQNTALEGLYASSRMLCTQCEAQGFRRITYFPDRPDVMSRFRVKLSADKQTYPVLLCNGNPVAQGDLDNGRHYVVWEDPSLKPSYLFALVAGDLKYIEDEFVTLSGRRVQLRLYTEAENIHKCDHAMASLKQAMAWDEQTYGREYDLDIYMIVAVNDFNMGAMENKGLNIFNASCVLASPETATDDDFYSIQSIIGHEYFHNWSGNRVTCRDWFQLSLKEGFTVFRDQEFSSDLNSRAVKRIDDVNVLRTHQFAEDSGPMAHPVRPDHYIEISNFYTVTVYNKGAEVVRMLRNLLGADGFRKGTDLYFQRHDGQAVTCDDFVKAMEDANAVNLHQFKNWYSQAGTPELNVRGEYDAGRKTYTLHIDQRTPVTPGQAEKQPFQIPVAVGLLDARGQDMPLHLSGQTGSGETGLVLDVHAPSQQFVFTDVPQAPVASVLRGFSAPVKVTMPRSEEELAFLLAHDSDAFNRWDAGQQLALQELQRQIKAHQANEPLPEPVALTEALRKAMTDIRIDKMLLSQILTLPSESYLADQMDVVDVDAIYHARLFTRRYLAQQLYPQFVGLYEQNSADKPYVFNSAEMARRALKSVCLSYLTETERTDEFERCYTQFRTANNMTDQQAALASLSQHATPLRLQALTEFYERWHSDAQVVDKWLGIQARSRLPETLDNVKALMQHPAFTLKNPNKVRALIGSFCRANPVRFHASDGSGYAFLTENVLALDKLNPQIAARLVQAIIRWQRFDEKRQALMQASLQQILETAGLSRDTYEVVARGLNKTQ
ncbi:MAG: aminopeptidase N [Gammaproteobacteria bacterium]|nr:aminopeptidase N [Gammaproteobacteria bacterium]